MVWLRRAAICLTVAVGLLWPGVVRAQEMPGQSRPTPTAMQNAARLNHIMAHPPVIN